MRPVHGRRLWKQLPKECGQAASETEETLVTSPAPAVADLDEPAADSFGDFSDDVDEIEKIKNWEQCCCNKKWGPMLV